MDHNVIWACARLSKTELVEVPKQGYARITPATPPRLFCIELVPKQGYVRIASAGESYLDTYSGKIGMDELDSDCPAYKKWLDGRAENRKQMATHRMTETAAAGKRPLEAKQNA